MIVMRLIIGRFAFRNDGWVDWNLPIPIRHIKTLKNLFRVPLIPEAEISASREVVLKTLAALADKHQPRGLRSWEF